MKRNFSLISILVSSALSAAFYEDASERLFADLELVQEIDRKKNDQLPLLVNYQLQGGYFTMPSARSYDAGTFSFGYAALSPYHLWGLGFQFFDHLETTGNYWVYKGVLDGGFGHLGFGDSAERSANIKLIFLRRQDGFPDIPNVAIGWNDFMGTRRFYSFYVAATKEILPWNLEASLGWGRGRIHGFFGGLAWTPFRNTRFPWKTLSLVAEYDANDYKHHPHEHPNGRKVGTRINAGIQWSLWDKLRLSASSLRGNHWAASAAFIYNLGNTPGLFPKIYDGSFYSAPVNTEPFGELRTQQEFAQELAYASKEQGFDLSWVYFIPEREGKDHLWIQIINVRYREENVVRKRIEYLLASLLPSNVSRVTVVMEADGVATQEYRFRREDLVRYREGKMGDPELAIIAPLKEASRPPDSYEGTLLYQRKKPVWILTFRPWLRTFFGSSRGKFKYETGFLAGFEGYLFRDLYYGINGTYTALSSTANMSDQDILNPSHLLVVRTDTIRYNQSSSFQLQQAYVQKSWNWGSGWFSRLALGYFEVAYTGVAAEILYYPVNTSWALGFSGANVWKRSYSGVGIQRKVKKLSSSGVYQRFPYVGVQYFLDVYYEYKPYHLDFKCSIGQFLARDKGIRIEGSRTFESGLRFGLWYTMTNANDRVNGSRYYDKGFFFSVPLDMFMNKSSRTRIGYAMSAWLRDCGATAATGKPLYPTLYWERYNYNASSF